MSRSSTLVTIFGGANDVNVVGNGIERGLGGGNPVGWGTPSRPASAATSRPSSTVCAPARRRPRHPAQPAERRRPALRRHPQRDELRILQAISVRFSAEANVHASRGVLVVDLMCDPRSYLPSNYSSDGFHPNDAGYAFMAEVVLNAVNAGSLPPPRSDCPQMHLAD